MAWMKTIDSGKDDEITDVIQTFDGGYAIAGGFSNVACNRASHFPTTPKIIWLSEKGDIVAEREYTSELKDTYGYENSIKGIVQTMDNGFYIISQRGMILKTNPSGIPGNKPLDNKVIHGNIELKSVIRTSEGGSAIAGVIYDSQPFVAKLDREGNQSWFTKISNENFSKVISLIELPGNSGYIGQGQSSARIRPLFKLDNDGRIENTSAINLIKDVYQIHSIPEGFAVFSMNQSMNNTFEVLSYTDEGNAITTTFLENITPDARIIADESSYFSVTVTGSFYPVNSTVHAQKLDSNGKTIWDRRVTTFDKKNKYLVNVRNVIATSDGGYLIVLAIEKQKSC